MDCSWNVGIIFCMMQDTPLLEHVQGIPHVVYCVLQVALNLLLRVSPACLGPSSCCVMDSILLCGVLRLKRSQLVILQDVAVQQWWVR